MYSERSGPRMWAWVRIPLLTSFLFFPLSFFLSVGQGDLSKSNDAANEGKTATRSGYSRIQAGGYGAPGIIIFKIIFAL